MCKSTFWMTYSCVGDSRTVGRVLSECRAVARLAATMQLSNQTVVFLSRSLLASFISLVTLWYFVSPYLVRPHPQFAEDM